MTDDTDGSHVAQTSLENSLTTTSPECGSYISEPMVMMMPIADIQIGERRRRDLGDVAGLAQSINDLGLLHPIVITPEKMLICGARRLATKVLE